MTKKDMKIDMNDGLEFHTLMFGESYMFSFKPAILPWIETLFFCSFTWSGNRDFCNTCNWKINKTGDCTYIKEDHIIKRCYRWERVEVMDVVILKVVVVLQGPVKDELMCCSRFFRMVVVIMI
ncbi:hypothetical protein MTR_7g114830 [Medicago truncatula]|uniref:S-protein homolog n=1 Tax=Medicago truncatula TaxID=3880 RepID=G7L1T6_MEDTR|nr:hypothetical protein MTR_7g114830 [Medicago truncatula]